MKDTFKSINLFYTVNPSIVSPLFESTKVIIFTCLMAITFSIILQ